MPLDHGIEIVGFVGAFLRAQHQHPNHVADDDLQMLSVLFVQSQQKRREHSKDHQHGSRRITQGCFGGKIQRDTNQQPQTETDQLPLCQIEKHLGFDVGQVLWNGYIRHRLTSLMGVEYGFGKTAGFEQAEA